MSLLLPGMDSKADEWLDFMQRQRQFWPTMTSGAAMDAPLCPKAPPKSFSGAGASGDDTKNVYNKWYADQRTCMRVSPPNSAWYRSGWSFFGCLGEVPGGVPFSQLHKGIGNIVRTGQHMQSCKPKQIQPKQRQQQIPDCGGREDETDARAVRPNSLARCIE